jgi:hypothetical protein
MANAARIGQDLLNVPMGEMIRDMAFAIAEAQVELDEASIHTATFMSDAQVAFGGDDLSMIELGFTPTFYQFVDTVIEVKIAIKMTREREHTRSTSQETESNERSFGLSLRRLRASRGNTVSTSTVDAMYSNKYSYSAEGSSLLRTKLAPVPPPAALEARIQMQLEEARRDGGDSGDDNQ